MASQQTCPSCGAVMVMDIASTARFRCPECKAPLGRKEAAPRNRVDPAKLFPEVPAEFFEMYALECVLGSGACGVVYLARELAGGETRALKVLSRADPESLERFLREGRALAELDHPRVVRVMEVHHLEGRACMVAEYMSGGTLRDELRRETQLAPLRAGQVLRDVLSGLSACHQRGIVHRDVKPENVLFGADGRAKIGDLGVAKFYGSTGAAITSTGAIVGTPRYMSPEQLRGEAVGAASDLFSAGVLLHEMLTGRPAFEAATVYELALLHQEIGIPALPEEIVRQAPGLASLHDRLLGGRVDERPATAADAIAELECGASVGHQRTPRRGAPVSPRAPSGPGDVMPTPRSGRTPAPDGRAAHASRLTPRGVVAILALGSAVLLTAALGIRHLTRYGPVPAPSGSGAPTHVAAAPARLLIAAVQAAAPETMIPPLVLDRRWDRGLDFPGMAASFGLNQHFVPAVPHHRVPPGWLRTEFLATLSRSGVRAAFESFRPHAAAFFAAADVEPLDKRRTYSALLRLELLETLIMAQYDSNLLGIRDAIAPLVERTWRLCDSHRFAPAGWTSLFKSGTMWVTEDVMSYAGVQLFAEFSPELMSDLGIDTGKGWQAKTVCRTRRSATFTLPRDTPANGLLVVEALVASLGPAYFVDVVMGSADGSDPVTVRLTHPGTMDWFLAMDDLSPTSVMGREKSGAGRPWGLIRAFVPVALLPRGELDVTVTYRHLPGVTLAAMSQTERALMIAHLRIRVEPGAAPAR